MGTRQLLKITRRIRAEAQGRKAGKRMIYKRKQMVTGEVREDGKTETG